MKLSKLTHIYSKEKYLDSLNTFANLNNKRIASHISYQNKIQLTEKTLMTDHSQKARKHAVVFIRN